MGTITETQPKLSIVIPTKLARETIKKSIATVFAQDYKNYEIIVSDAGFSDELERWVTSLQNERVKYFRPTSRRSFSGDWEFALSKASGDFITFLGDDDGLIPNALSTAATAFYRFDISAFTWKKINYNWPCHLVPHEQNIIEGESSPVIDLVDGRKALKMLSKFRLGYNRLPCIYNSFVSKKAIQAIRDHSPDNLFFSGLIPDVYSAIALCSVVEKYLYAHFPLSVNAAANSSSGVMQGIPDLPTEKKALISDVLSSESKYHKDIGHFNTSVAAIVMGEYQIAKKTLGLPEASWRAYVHYLCYEAKYSKHPDLILNAARHTKAARNMWIHIPKPRTPAPKEERACSFSGRLRIPTSSIDDVEKACSFCASLIPNELKLSNRLGLVSRISQTIKSSLLSCYRTYQNYNYLDKTYASHD